VEEGDMNWTIWKLPVLIPLVAVSSASFARSHDPTGVTERARITVLVYNYAHVPESTLEQAKRLAAVIFRGAKVGIVWRDCRPVLAADFSETIEAEPVEGGELVLRIVPRFEHEPGIMMADTLGLALGNLAVVSYRAVRDAALDGVGMPQEILGAAIAHELGHLLLGPHSHSATGIMQAGWSREGSARRRLNALTFTPQQAQSIRNEVGGHASKWADENGKSTFTLK
jgi:hypothetical protein